MMQLPLLIMVVMKLLEDKLVLVVSLNLRASIILILLMFMLKVPLMVLLLMDLLMDLLVLSYQVNSQLALTIVIHVILNIYVMFVLLDTIYLLKVTNVLLI
jgi:hypothetical protein